MACNRGTGFGVEEYEGFFPRFFSLLSSLREKETEMKDRVTERWTRGGQGPMENDVFNLIWDNITNDIIL